MTRVIQSTLFSGVALWRVVVTKLAWRMIVYPVIVSHVTAPGTEIRDGRIDPEETHGAHHNTELRPEGFRDGRMTVT